MKIMKLLLVSLTALSGYSATAQWWTPASAGPADQIDRTGITNIGTNTAYKGVGQFEINGINAAGPTWDAFLFNGGGSGKILRLKGGWKGFNQPLFQVEANDDLGLDANVSNIRFNVLANGNCGIGDIVTPTNRLVITDNQSDAGFLKLSNYNNDNNSKWWLGFTRGTGTDDASDITRIGTKSVTDPLTGTQTGKLYFRTGVNLPNSPLAQQITWIDEYGKVGMGIENPDATLDIYAHSTETQTVRINARIEEQYNVTQRPYNGSFVPGGWLLNNTGLIVERADQDRDDVIGIQTYGRRYGIYAKCINPFAPGIISFAGYFDGDVFATGYYTPSDMKLKHDVRELNGALDKISKLSPKAYYYRTEEYKNMNLRRGENLGFIAEELEQVFPNLVKQTIHPANKDEKEIEYKSVDYISLIPVLTAGIQELNAAVEEKDLIIAEMQQKLDELTKRIEQIAAASGIQTSNANTKPYLEQNAPNPFTENTTIGYFIPSSTERAGRINIYTVSGSKVRTFDVSNGKGQIQLQAGTLPAGNYIYELMIGDEKIDSKKMVLNK